MEKVLIALGYDRFPNSGDPLVYIIQCLWDNDIDSINRFVDSTLEFIVSADDKAKMEQKIHKLQTELEQIIFVRLYFVVFSKGEGNLELDNGLQEYIAKQETFGALKRPKGYKG